MRKNTINWLSKGLVQNFSIIKIYKSKMVLLSQDLFFLPMAGSWYNPCHAQRRRWYNLSTMVQRIFGRCFVLCRNIEVLSLWFAMVMLSDPSIALWRFCFNFTREGATTTDIAKYILYLEWEWKSFYHRNKIVHDNCI